ncbi:MAG: hypothetical protein M1835_005860 [Candelina submexicana]|nr:MAG: hypothetical protein M1835_005860 [Candelina submexicana]
MPMRIAYEVHGDVQGEAQGEESSLQKFIQDLGEGPSAASVTKVENSEIDEVKGENSFNTK